MSLSNLNFSPGAKNWIPKYFDLVEKEIISLSIDLKNDLEVSTLRLLINKTGLQYGSCTQFIYAKNIDSSRYTKDEQLKLLLFETLIYVYFDRFEKFDKDHFLRLLEEFYQGDNPSQFSHWLGFFSEKSKEGKIEKILSDRVKVKSTIFGSNYWLNHLSNSFVFLDVLLFESFLQNNSLYFFESYEPIAVATINCLAFSAYFDNQLIEKEQRMLWHFLASADLEKELKIKCERSILEGITKNEIDLKPIQDLSIKIAIYELSIFVIKGSDFISEEEELKSIEFGHFLGLSENDIQISFMLCNAFLLENEDEVKLLNSESNTQFIYRAFTKRWFRILGRNKDKLVQELKESKELISLIQKSTKEELSKEEKELVKSQFMDILKSMPSMAIFLLPGGGLLLPLILKIVPDLLPSSFKENELEK
ncbi:MAG: LETM1 domain-containing protein [Bacteroidota bacterium]